MYNLEETIRPSADLRNHYADISRECRESNNAVIITVNGRGDTVSISYEEYKRMKARLEMLEMLAEAEDDVKNDGKIHPRIILIRGTLFKLIEPKYRVLRKQGYRVLIHHNSLIFYKVDHPDKSIMIYAIVDHRQDYLDIIKGL